MHPIRTALLALGLMATGLASAQSDTDVVQMQRAKLEADRLPVVTAGMQMTDAESEKFWPIYREYRDKVATLNDRLLALIKQYADNYGSLQNDQAAELIREYFKLEEEGLKLLRKYVSRVERELNAVLAMRFMQIENKLGAVTHLDIASQIPMAK